MNDIIDYLGDATRPLKAGLDLYKSQHVINAGKANVSDDAIDVYGQVLQSSDPRGVPHDIKITGVRPNNVEDWLAVCSCKAGLGHKCKHIFAVLLYILKYVKTSKVRKINQKASYICSSKDNLEVMSCTDVEQQWGITAREKSIQPFDAKLISDLCCVSKSSLKPVSKVSKEIKQSNFRRLVNGRCI